MEPKTEPKTEVTQSFSRAGTAQRSAGFIQRRASSPLQQPAIGHRLRPNTKLAQSEFKTWRKAEMRRNHASFTMMLNPAL